MRNTLTALTVIFAAVHMMTLVPVSPAVAISVEVAKKCRDLAIRAHPPEPAGTKAYAQAERDFFRQCVAKNGDITGPEKAPASGQE